MSDYDDAYPESDAPVTTPPPEDDGGGWVMPWEVPALIAASVSEAAQTAFREGGASFRAVAPTVVEKVDEAQDEGVSLTERVLTAIAGLTFGVPTTIALVGVGALAADQLLWKGAGRKAVTRALLV